MDWLPIILEQLGGGPGAVALVCAGWLYWQERKQKQDLQSQLFEMQEKRIEREAQYASELRQTAEGVREAVATIRALHGGQA